MKRNGFWTLLAASCMLGACAAPRIAGVPLEDPVLAAGFKKLAAGPCPASFRAQHRVTLTFRGRQFDFTGYLLVKRPGAWRAAAFGEFGGSLFDIAALPGKGPRVIKSLGISEHWLTGPAADIIEILYLPPGGEPVSVSRGSSSIVLTYRRGTGEPEEFSFPDGPDSLPEGRVSVSRGGEVYDIAYSDYAEFPGVEQKVPRHIIVESKKIKLRLEMELLKLEPMEIPEKYFNE